MKGGIQRAAVAALLVSTMAAPAAAGSWTYVDELIQPRQGLVAEAVDGVIYAVGGTDSPHVPPYANGGSEAYDPGMDLWTARATMPTRRHTPVSAVVGGRIYVIGGHVANSRSENQSYDPMTNTWATHASMPTHRSDGAAAAIGNSIYVFGGNRFGSIQSVIQRYDTTTNTWATVGNVPYAGAGWRAAALDGTIYLTGGGNSGGSGFPGVIAYDPGTGVFDASVPDFNVGRHSHALVQLGGRLWAVGGANPTLGRLASVESWAPGESAWRDESALNDARSGLAAAVLDGAIYAIGGSYGSSQNVLTVERLQVVPEPASAGLFLLGLGGLAAQRSRRWRVLAPGGHPCASSTSSGAPPSSESITATPGAVDQAGAITSR